MTSLNNISIILVKPQMGENIGAAARIMHNFGLTDLRLIAPRDGWPNQKAIDMASGAAKIIANAKVFDSFENATADLTMLYATTARERDMNKEALTPREFSGELSQNHKTGIVFGPERSGLENFEVTHCNKILYIPVNPEYRSLNIAQAVAVICYEVSQAPALQQSPSEAELAEKATKGDYNALFSFLESALDASNFFQVAEKKPKMMDNIRNIFSRLDLSDQEMRTLRGVLKALTSK
jgi:tRNA/rRNA methyltransferase